MMGREDDIINNLNMQMTAADEADLLMVELDMKSTKLFDYQGDMRAELHDWLIEQFGVIYRDFREFKKLPEDSRAVMFECISTTGITCAYLTFKQRKDVTLFVMSWQGAIGEI